MKVWIHDISTGVAIALVILLAVIFLIGPGIRFVYFAF
jgi:hypothetical protein